jgi:hypothetical protein
VVLLLPLQAAEIVWAWLKDVGLARDIPQHDALMFFITCFT